MSGMPKNQGGLYSVENHDAARRILAPPNALVIAGMVAHRLLLIELVFLVRQPSCV
jgi:hypothetical protein